MCVLRRVMRQSEGGEGEAECDRESLLSGFPLPSSAKNSCVVLPSNCRYVNLLSLLSLFSWIFLSKTVNYCVVSVPVDHHYFNNKIPLMRKS